MAGGEFRGRPETGKGTLVALRGIRAIAAHLKLGTREVAHLVRQRKLPVMIIRGCPIATAAALDDWWRIMTIGIEQEPAA